MGRRPPTKRTFWFLQKSVRMKKCLFSHIFESERLLTIGCRTTCLRKNLVGDGAAGGRTQTQP